MTDRTSPETETLIAPDIKGEMARIKKLFDGVVGDKEDLISYAREIVRLRGDAAVAKVQLDGAVERGLKMLDAKNYWMGMYTDLLKIAKPGQGPDTSTDRTSK